MLAILGAIGITDLKLDKVNNGVRISWKYSTKIKPDSIYIFKSDDSHPENSPLLLSVVYFPETVFVDTQKKEGNKYLVRVFYGKDKFDTEWIVLSANTQSNLRTKETQNGIISFDKDKIPILVAISLFSALFLAMLWMARTNPKLYIRRIGGLDAIDEAVGRTAELGKPIIYTTGIGSIDTLPILAGLTVLRHVTKKSALYEVPVVMPNNDPLVLAAAREVVREAYVESGRPDLYSENDILFLTTEQFGFASGISGMMQRMKPGAVFMMGYFYAESLILAENANVSGAISTAGTTAIDQLPFFIAACDYTIIGDELYAASAYISRDPREVASIKTSDWFKSLSVMFIILGSILATGATINPATKDILNGLLSFFLTGG